MKKKNVLLISLMIVSVIVFSVDYSLDSFTLENVIFPDGSMLVHERYEYVFFSEYRGLIRQIPQGRYVTMEDIKIWTEGLSVKKNHFTTKNEREFGVQIWLVPYGSENQINYKKHPKIILNVMYTVKYVLEKGVDCSQLFRKFWGEEWDIPVNNVEVKYVFPEKFLPNKYYIHASFENQAKLEENVFLLKANKIPRNNYGELRFVFDYPIEEKYTAINNSLTISAIENAESN